MTKNTIPPELCVQPAPLRLEALKLIDATQKLINASLAEWKQAIMTVGDTVLLNTRAIPQTEQFVRSLLELVEDDHLDMGDHPVVADCSVCGAILEVTETLGNCALLLSVARTRKVGHLGHPGVEPNKPLSEAERSEYQRIFEQWTSNGGTGAETLTPLQIARFSDLSDRISFENCHKSQQS